MKQKISLLLVIVLIFMGVGTKQISIDALAAGEVTFQDDFSGDLSQWTYVNPNDTSKVYIENDMLKVTSDSEYPQIKANVTTFHNGTIDFRVKKFTANDGNFRIYFRHVSDQESTVLLMKTAGTTANIYTYLGNEVFSESFKIGDFDMSTDNYFDVRLLVEDELLTVYMKNASTTQYTLIASTSHISSGTGGLKIVGVKGSQPSGTFYFDNVRLASMFKDEFDSGLSQWTYVNQNDASKVYIDNEMLKVTSDAAYPQIKANVSVFHNGTIDFRVKKFTASDGNFRMYLRHVSDQDSTVFLMKTSGTVANIYTYPGNEGFSESFKIGNFDMSADDYFDVRLLVEDDRLNVYMKNASAIEYTWIASTTNISAGIGGYKIVGVKTSTPSGAFYFDNVRIQNSILTEDLGIIGNATFHEEFNNMNNWSYVDGTDPSKITIEDGKLKVLTDETAPAITTSNYSDFHDGTIMFNFKKFVNIDGNIRLHFRHVDDDDTTYLMIRTSGNYANFYLIKGDQAFSEGLVIDSFDMVTDYTSETYFDVKMVVSDDKVSLYYKADTEQEYEYMGTTTNLSMGTGGLKIVGKLIAEPTDPAGIRYLDNITVLDVLDYDNTVDNDPYVAYPYPIPSTPSNGNMFTDSDYVNGMYLTATDSTVDQIFVEELDFLNQSATTPHWDLAQWWSRYSFEGVEPVQLPAGGVEYSNLGKRVVKEQDTAGNTVVTLKVNGSNEYEYARLQGEHWPALLLEQKFQESPKLSELSSFVYHYEVKITEMINCMDPLDYNQNLHTAQIVSFFAIRNMNPDTPTYGSYIWFGVPIFDYRYDIPVGNYAVDGGKAVNTGMFINTVEGSEFWSSNINDGQWHTLHTDLLPYMRAGFDRAKKRNYLKGATIDDMIFGSYNTGWEVPGTFDTGAQFKNISATYVPSTSVYSDTFEDELDGLDPSDWIEGGGNWQVENDGENMVYWQSGNANVGANSTINCNVADLTYEGKFKVNSWGTGGNVWYTLRWTDSNNHIQAGYDNFSKKWVIRQRVNGVLTTLASLSETIDIDEWYLVQVVASSGNIDLYVDGNKKLSTTSCTITSPGRIGVYSSSADTYFDNFTIFE